MHSTKRRNLILISILIAAVLVLTGTLVFATQVTAYAAEADETPTPNATEPHDHVADNMTAIGQAQYDALTNGTLMAGTYYLSENITGDITVSGTVTLCLNGKTVTGSGTDSVIKVSANANFTLCDCTGEGIITGGIGNSNGNTTTGGGVYAANSNVQFTMNGGKITGNNATDGGGVIVGGQSQFTMNGGAITGNNASYGGGGVYIGNDTGSGTFIMNGGKITDNNAQKGGGVNATRNSFKMNGGEISGNTASGDGGGVWTQCSSTLSGGKITGNNATKGGGVYVTGGVFKMTGGEIGANTASGNGGGVCNLRGTFTMSSGEVSNNNAQKGGGVYALYNLNVNDDRYEGEFTTSGTAVISGNTASGDGGGVYAELTIDGGISIPIPPPLTGSGDIAVVSAEDEEPDYKGTFTVLGGEIKNNTATNGGGVYSKAATVNMLGGTVSENEANGGDGGGVCLEGIIKDSKSYGELILSDGALISNNTATFDDSKDESGEGGGVEVDNGGALTMNGGEISENEARWGGGVNFDDGTFTMTGGRIINNHADNQGGGVSISYSTFTMENGEISANTTGYGGGGVKVGSDGTFTMKGGTISNNTAGGDGGGVQVGSDGTFTMKGGTIRNNSAGGDGGGVRIGDEVEVNVSGTPIITENKANGADSNVYLDDNRIIVTGVLENEDGDKAKIGIYNSGEIATGFTSANNPTGKKPSAYFIPDNDAVCIGVSDTENGIVTIGGEHTGGTATCIAKAICSVCDLPYGEINPDNHVYATDYTVDKEPTCTEKGSKSKHCTLCDNAKTDVTEISANGHVFTHYEAQGATCNEDGVLAYSHCAVCDKNFIGGALKSDEDLITPALGHDYGAWTVVKPATATEEGEEQRVCKNNPSHVESRAIPKIINKEQNPSGQKHDIALIIVVAILAGIVLAETVYCVYHAIRSKKVRKEEKK